MTTVTQTPEIQRATATLSLPRVLLHLEGLALLAGAIALYIYQGNNWWIFAIFLLVPDLFAVGYLINPRIGAYTDNLVHTTLLPLGLAVISIFIHSDIGIQIALIWFAHIGMDRTLGYGLKYASAFKETHLGRV